jgi:uncharacterized protein YqeY
MTIEEELRAELTDAMKTSDKARLDTVRMVTSEVLLAKSAPGFSGVVDDDLYLSVISAQVKKDEKSIEEYGQLGERGQPMVDKFTAEVAYLSRWLPTRMGEAETRSLVESAITELDVERDPKSSGRVIGHIMKTHRNEVDGALVNKLVREALDG